MHEREPTLSGPVANRPAYPVARSERLARIATVDTSLHSYAHVMADQALADARRADQEIAAGQARGPLHGVPLAVKDLVWVAGAPACHGMMIHKNFIPSEDATVIRRLRAGGAVILGKLQQTEGAFADHHPDITPPVNPWGEQLWPGASSSGSGVATAAGLCFGSLGTDTGGSIRFPSAANGITGLKPTWGRVSRYGAFELAASLDHIGPMARSTADPKYRIGQALLGGYNGMPDVPPLIWPTADGGVELSALAMFVLVVVLCAACYVLLSWLLMRPFGRIMTAVRENEWRTAVLGFDVRLHKLLVFSLGGGIAGLAGGLYAAWAMFVSPGVFSLQLAALVVIWVLVGGRASLAGAFVGALLVESLTFMLGGSGGAATPIVLGSVLIAVVLLLPGGLMPSVQTWLGDLRKRSENQASNAKDANAVDQNALSASALPALHTRAALSLGTQDLSKHFGGVQAVRQASVEFAPRGVHCLIGPNGAGKSSFSIC